jgi:primosomal protein N'
MGRGIFVARKQFEPGGASVLASRSENYKRLAESLAPSKQKKFMSDKRGYMKALKCRECGRE